MGACLHHVQAINLSSLMSSLYVVKKGDRRKFLSGNGLPYSNGVSCNSVLQCVCKLQPFL